MEPRKLLTLLMDSKNLNPNSLSEKLKNATTQSQIHRFETGKTREPKQATLRPVAEFFGLPVEVFYSEDLADSVAQRLKEGKPLIDPVVAQYAPFLTGDTKNITAHKIGTARQTVATPLGVEAERKLTRFLAALYQIPDAQRSAALSEAIEVLIDHLPPPPRS